MPLVDCGIVKAALQHDTVSKRSQTAVGRCVRLGQQKFRVVDVNERARTCRYGAQMASTVHASRSRPIARW
jgi:hypothetical protein